MSSPLTDILTPNEKQRGGMIAGGAEVASAAAGVKTITLGNGYPAINRKIQSPVLLILLVQYDPVLVQNGCEAFFISGQMDRATAPDSAGEFQITGARTIDVYSTANNETLHAIVFYIPEGSGAKV